MYKELQIIESEYSKELERIKFTIIKNQNIKL